MPEPLQFKTIDEAIDVYVGVRDDLRVHMKKAKEKETELKDLMERVSMWLRDKADELGVDQFKGKSGTAYRNEKHKYRMEDWDAFIDYVSSTGNFHLLEKRVAVRAAREIHQTDGEVPPGLNYFIEVEFNVLRPKGTSKKLGDDDYDR